MNAHAVPMTATTDTRVNRWVPVLNRASWIVACAAAVGLVGAMVFLGRNLWRYFPHAVLLAFAFGVAGIRVRRIALIAVALVLCVFPALCIYTIGGFYWPYHAIWMAVVLGAALGSAPRRWVLPPAIAVPVALWALSVSVAAPLVAAREADFTMATLARFGARNSGIPASIIVAGIVFVGAWTLTAILWFDRLFATYSERPRATFAREIVAPLSAGWLVATLVALYQWKVNLAFLSPGFWVGLGRATGTLLDANPFGVMCAMWGFVIACVVLRWRRSIVAVPTAALVVALSWAGVWASGSRGAFVVAGAGTLAVAWLAGARILNRTARITALSVGLVVLVAGAWVGRSSGPLERLTTLRAVATAPRASLGALWDRDGYGAASVRMIRDQPWAGAGIGSFHHLVGSYTPPWLDYRLPADNAQNWYRHQLAEFGLIGSIGCLLWVLVIGYALVRRPSRPIGPDVAGVRWILLAFGVVSLVAMPGQDPAVGMIVLTLSFWYVTDARIVTPRLDAIAASPRAWIAVWLLVVVFAGLTAAASHGELRPAFRAARFGEDYSYGVHPDGNGRAWTDRRAVLVLASPAPWLKLTYGIEHPDAATAPVSVDIWRDNERIVHRRLWNDVRVTTYVQVPGGGKRFVLEARVNRTFPSSTGVAATVQRGLDLQWEFVDHRPQVF